MRAVATIVVALALFLGTYYLYFKKMPVTDEGTSPTQAINLTGVRSDLLQIAQGERAYIVANGRCGSLEELIASDFLHMSSAERDGYVYAVQCSGGNFSATALHPPDFSDSHVRYPVLKIDGTMQIAETK